MSEKNKADLYKVTRTAEKLANTTLPQPQHVVEQRLKTKALRITTSNTDPVLTFDMLPSGRFRAVKARINLRRNCFRAIAINTLNK